MTTEARKAVIRTLAGLVVDRRGDGRFLRVGFDGVDAAGKTTLADEVAASLHDDGWRVIRASIDGFHRPAADRRRREKEDPGLSYYEDSFDYPALRRNLLDPLAARGEGTIRTRVYDFREDRHVEEPSRRVEAGSILLFDGVFLLRPELEGCWDLSVFIRIGPETSVTRALERDLRLFGSADTVEERYRRRYLPGQQIYLSTVDPETQADIVIDNDDTDRPFIIGMPPASGPASSLPR